ncbi:hypothetical protein PENTCL1PPCAC_21020, partial [Pristionchus entomophagus]
PACCCSCNARKLLIALGNILITALLWTAAFAGQRRCLPIYTMLEIIFYGAVSIWLLGVDRLPIIYAVFLLPLFIFCIMFIPIVIVSYYQSCKS